MGCSTCFCVIGQYGKEEGSRPLVLYLSTAGGSQSEYWGHSCLLNCTNIAPITKTHNNYLPVTLSFLLWKTGPPCLWASLLLWACQPESLWEPDQQDQPVQPVQLCCSFCLIICLGHQHCHLVQCNLCYSCHCWLCMRLRAWAKIEKINGHAATDWDLINQQISRLNLMSLFE